MHKPSGRAFFLKPSSFFKTGEKQYTLELDSLQKQTN